MTSPLQPRFLFVGGCERSGTTLLQKLLCAHSSIQGGPELVFGGRIAELHRQMSWIVREGPEPFRRRLETFLSPEELDRHFRDFYVGFFRDPALWGDSPLYLSEKTPSNIFSAEALLDLFPESCFVHILRDGRDVVASHRDVARRAGASSDGDNEPSTRLRHVCSRWNRAVTAHFELLGNTEYASRYRWIRFEDLLVDPRGTLTALLASLGLDLEARQLHPESLADSPAVVDGIWHEAENDPRGFEPERAGRWRNDLGFPTKRLAECWMSPGLSALGYPIGRVALRLGQTLAKSRPRRRHSEDRRPRSNRRHRR